MSSQSHQSSSDDFLREVEAVSSAEERASKKVQDAKAEAEKIKAKAQGQAVEVSTNASEKAVAEKNKIILARRHAAEVKIGQLLNRAGQKSEDYSSRRLPESAVKDICETI